MLYLLLVFVLAGLAYAIWRSSRTVSARPRTRMVGPDDDPDFLRKLGKPDNDPR